MSEEAAKELYSIVRQMQADLAAQTAILSRMEAEQKEMRKKILELEIDKARRNGFIAAAGMLGSAATTLVWWLIRRFAGGET